MQKEIRKLHKTLRGLGFIVQFAGSGHAHILRPDGTRIASMACTPRNPNSIKAAIRDLRKAGVPV